MPKYTKGWLCRDWLNDRLWFFNKLPHLSPICVEWWTAIWDEPVLQRSWTSKRFRKIYTCNFSLPKPGYKVECEVEL